MSGHRIRGAIVDWKANEDEQNEVRQGVKMGIGYGGPSLGTAWRGRILKWRLASGRGCC